MYVVGETIASAWDKGGDSITGKRGLAYDFGDTVCQAVMKPLAARRMVPKLFIVSRSSRGSVGRSVDRSTLVIDRFGMILPQDQNKQTKRGS